MRVVQVPWIILGDFDALIKLDEKIDQLVRSEEIFDIDMHSV